MNSKMNSTIALKLKMQRVEWEIRNRSLKKRLEKCAECREKGDLLVKKREIYELHIDVLEKQCLENASLLREAQQEIERLNAVVAHYEHQIASYSQRGEPACDVGEYFEIEKVAPQTPLNNSVCVSAPSATNEPDVEIAPLDIEIKKELAEEMDNASVTLCSQDVTAEDSKRFDPNFQPENVESGNWKCEQDERRSVVNGNEGCKSGTEGEEQNGEDDDDNDETKYEELPEESKPCRWIQDVGELCGHVSKDSSKRMKHLIDKHLGHPGPDGYVCLWDDCKRKARSIKTIDHMMVHLQYHSCQKYLRCTFEGCNMVYRCISALMLHRNTHRRKGSFKCTYPGCTEVFKRFLEMMRHRRMHKARKPRILPVPKRFRLFVCDVQDCGRTFKYAVPFQKHVEKHKMDEDSN